MTAKGGTAAVIEPGDEPAARERFLDALAEGDLVTVAARKSGASFKSLYNWRRDDPIFAIEWEIAYAQGTENVYVAEAKRRAVDGVEKPVHFKGIRVDTVTEYSDSLLTLLLGARDPQNYCPKLRAARILKAEQDEAARRAAERDRQEFEFKEDVRDALEKIAAAKTANAPSV